MEILHNFAIDFSRVSEPSFQNFLEILSTSAAFEMLIHCKTCKTFFSVVKVRLKLYFSSIFCNIDEQNSYQIYLKNLEDS